MTTWPGARAFLEAAVAYFAKLSIRIERVMTDNGSCYRSKSFRAACKRLGLRQIFTKPYTPRTKGKAERFIQTALSGLTPAYQKSDQRSAEPSNCGAAALSSLVQRMTAENGSAFLSKGSSANLNACRRSLVVLRRTL
jgi:transposase InsO family protein